jgi:hypothetical protein
MRSKTLKSFVCIFFFFISLVLDAQKGDLNLSRWHSGDKIADSEYQLVRKPGMYFFLSNDEDNFYIDIRIDDIPTQNRMLKEGFTVWIDMDGKLVRKMGVRFPLGSEDNPATSVANTIELIGFITEQERHFPSANADNFNGIVKFDDEGQFYYRLVMPMAKLPLRNSKDGKGAMPVFLGFEYGYSTPTKKPGEIARQPKSLKAESVNQPVRESGLFWIKNIKLATSK